MPKPECDLVISGGRVIDLSIASGVLDGMAIAVRDGVIVAMATAREIEASFTAGRVIDATGQVVAPGFVDAHVHLGAFLGAGRLYEPSTGPGLFCGGGRPEVVVPLVARMVSMSVPGEIVAAVLRSVLAAMLRAGFTGGRRRQSRGMGWSRRRPKGRRARPRRSGTGRRFDLGGGAMEWELVTARRAD